MVMAVAPLPMALSLVCAGVLPTIAQPLISIPGNISPALAHSQRHDDVRGNQRLSLAVTMKLRNVADLDRFLAAVNDPKSQQYHHFLSPQEFTAKYGPTKSDVDKTAAHLRNAGLRITAISPSRQVIDVTGSADQISRAFSTSIANYTDTVSRRSFYANASAPALPTDIAAIVQGVTGLDNHTVRRHFSPVARASAQPDLPDGYTPPALQTAYNVKPLGATGAGATIAYWEFDGYQASNIARYDSQFSLSATTPTTVAVDGVNYDRNPGAGQAEVESDVEIVHAIAPKAAGLVYEAPNSDAGQIDMTAKIASDNKADVVSMSWGSCEADTTQAAITGTTNAIKQGVAQGISYFAASGDDGSSSCTRSPTGGGVDAVVYPASDPNVTGVGGTTLFTNSDGTYRSETAWPGSGGGVSRVFSAPSWQQGSNGHRTVPDVASDAALQSGYAVYSVSSLGLFGVSEAGWFVIGGTSVATPMWAGFGALQVQKAGRLGNANPALYKLNGKGFHDITSGSNGSFTAGKGYDKVTGWGSYDATALSAALRGAR